MWQGESGTKTTTFFGYFSQCSQKKVCKPTAYTPEKLIDGMTMMHKGKANGVCYRLQMARVLGHYVLKRSHFGRRMHGYLDTDHLPVNHGTPASHGTSAVKVDDQMHRIVNR